MASGQKTLSGHSFPDPKIRRYEKTTSDNEEVAGRFGQRGSSDAQAQLWTSGRCVIFFTEQRSEPGTYSSKRNSAYAEDGKTIDGDGFGPVEGKGTLLSGESVTKGDPLEPVSGSGKLQAMTVGPLVAVALETVNAAGADASIRVLNLQNVHPLIITTETVTVTTHVGTLTNTPIEIEYVEATAGTATGNKGLIVDGTAAEGEVKVSYSAKTLTFSTTDAVTQAKVRYKY